MTKMVQLSDDAYHRLRSRKRSDESFSDVVRRLSGDQDLSALAGIRSDAEIRAHEAWLRGSTPPKETSGTQPTEEGEDGGRRRDVPSRD